MTVNKKWILVISVVILFLMILFWGGLVSPKTSFASWMEEENGVKYLRDDGQYAVGFIEIDEKRYYFDSDGYLVKGKFYVEDENAYYYADHAGVVQYGVIDTEDGFYMTEEDGRLKKGFVELDNRRFYFNDNVQLVKGWFEYEDNWYYADDTGALLTGFLTLDGYRYYLNADGTRVSDAVLELDGITYIFNKDGSVDENATALYPVFQYLNQVRSEYGLTELLLNTKVQACAILRATELEGGFERKAEDNLENLLKNRGVLCAGGYEFAYGGIPEYNIDRLVNDMKKDSNLLKILQDSAVSEVGLGVFTKEDINYFDIIFTMQAE